MSIRTLTLLSMTVALTSVAAGCASTAPAPESATPTSLAATSTAPAAEKRAAPPLAPESVQRPGFRVYDMGERWWILRESSPELDKFLRDGAPAQSVTRVAAGPARMSLRAVDAETIDAYLIARPGFYTEIRGGLVWVLREGSDALHRFRSSGPPAQSVTRVAAAPNGMSLRSDDAETIDAYLAMKPGFFTVMSDGRLWVTREGSPTHKLHASEGRFPAHSVTRVGVGPGGISIRSDDAETIDDYLAAKPGFVTIHRNNLLWVFREGSAEHRAFLDGGFPAHSVTRIGAGPGGRSIRATDAEIIDLYLASR